MNVFYHTEWCFPVLILNLWVHNKDDVIVDYGEFKEPVNLVGLDGVFYLNYKDEYVVDTMFLKHRQVAFGKQIHQAGLPMHLKQGKQILLISI